MNQHNSPSAARLMETLNNLFYLMVGLSLIAFVWVYLNLPAITPNIIFSVPAYRPYLHGLFLLGSLALLIWSLVQYRKSIKDPGAFSGPENIQEKVIAKVSFFRATSLKLYLLLTLSTLLVVAGFYLSARPEYAAAYSVLLIVFSLYRPTPERMMKDMKMKKEERDYFIEAARQDRMGQGNK